MVIEQTNVAQKRVVKDKKAVVEKYIFFVAILALPVLQFIIMYLGVNANSVIMSFQEYKDGQYVFLDDIFANYDTFFTRLINDPKLSNAVINSLVQYALTLLVSLPISVIVSYYLYIKIPFTETFKVVLMLPQMISNIVFVCIFRYLLEDGLIEIFNLPVDTLRAAPTQFYTMLIYGLFFSFATNMVLYLGAITGVDQSVMEYGEIDGLGTLGKFWYIVLPSIWPTITVFIVSGVAGIFTNQGATYSFFDLWALDETYTLGYWMFVLVKGSVSFAEYPLAATAGICFTIVATPLVLLVKYLLERFGPKEE